MRNTGVTSPDSYFYRAGLSQAAEQHLEKVGTGTAMVPNDVLYGFLKIGISVHEAGLLSDMGYPDAESLMTDPQLAEALPGTLVRTIRWGGSRAEDRSVENVVDYLAEGGIKRTLWALQPSGADCVLGEGDEHLVVDGATLTDGLLAQVSIFRIFVEMPRQCLVCEEPDVVLLSLPVMRETFVSGFRMLVPIAENPTDNSGRFFEMPADGRHR